MTPPEGSKHPSIPVTATKEQIDLFVDWLISAHLAPGSHSVADLWHRWQQTLKPQE